MMKRSIKLVIIFIACLLLVPSTVHAKDPETLGDLRREYEKLKKELEDNNNKSEAAKKEIAAKQAAIKQAQADLNKAEAEEEEVREKIDESNKKIEELTAEAKAVLLYSQQVKGSNVYVEYVSGATSMTEMIMRYEAIQQITDYIQSTVDNLDHEIELNEKLKIELQEKQENLAKQIDSYEATIERLTNNLEQYDQFALGIEEKYKIAKDNYEAYQKTCKENLGKTDDSLLLTDCSKVPVNNGWLNPLKFGIVTSTMGYRTHPTTGQRYKFHNAVDIGGNSEGTPVYAAAAGRVSGIVNRYYCGGNMLYIQVTVGGKKYTTFYYHLLRFNVKVGDIVDQNTVIGYVGGYSTSTYHGGYDTCSTGAHLHYGVAEGWYSGHTNNVITPPGMKNQVGYRFNSRTQLYWG